VGGPLIAFQLQLLSFLVDVGVDILRQAEAFNLSAYQGLKRLQVGLHLTAFNDLIWPDDEDSNLIHFQVPSFGEGMG
jgi:hypothetical protein